MFSKRSTIADASNSIPIQFRPKSSDATKVVPDPPNGSRTNEPGSLAIETTRSKSFNESSFAFRFLYFGCRTGGISYQTSVKFTPAGFILSLYRSEEHTSELQSLRHLVC